MAILDLVRMRDGSLMLQSTQPWTNADFSLFYLDGSGGDPKRCARGMMWDVVPGYPSAAYEPSNPASFREARRRIIAAAIDKGVSIEVCDCNLTTPAPERQTVPTSKQQEISLQFLTTANRAIDRVEAIALFRAYDPTQLREVLNIATELAAKATALVVQLQKKVK